MEKDPNTSTSSPETEAIHPDEDDIIEMPNHSTAQHDLEEGNPSSGKRMISNTEPKGIMERLVAPIEERWSIKMLTRIWQPRLEFIVRLMLVATFFDDSLRTATHLTQHIKQVGEQGCLSLLGAKSPLTEILALFFLGIGLLAQFLGSLCLLANRQPDFSTKALIGWTIAQPVLYGQLSNVEFITESLSLLGGLLLLRAHLVFDKATRDVGARTQLMGRLLLPSVYLYYAWIFIYYEFTDEETVSLLMYVSELSKSAVNAVVIAGFVVASTLLFFGLKSRIVAILLAVVNLLFISYLHPFFCYIWLENGKWKYDEVNMPMPQVALPTGMSTTELSYSPAEMYDLHRYYFFLGLSTSGALLLLAQFGPGEIAVQKGEVLLPVVRARD